MNFPEVYQVIRGFLVRADAEVNFGVVAEIFANAYLPAAAGTAATATGIDGVLAGILADATDVFPDPATRPAGVLVIHQMQKLLALAGI